MRPYGSDSETALTGLRGCDLAGRTDAVRTAVLVRAVLVRAVLAWSAR